MFPQRPLIVAVVLLSLPAMVVVTGSTSGNDTPEATAGDAPNACVGTMERQPDEATLVSIQGAELTGDGYEKRPALLVSIGPNGSFEWARSASANGRWWAYDVDRTSDGNLLFVTTESDATIVGELDPETNEYVWTERFDGSPDDDENPLVTDAHDADLLDDDELVIADKGEGHERLLVYDLTRREVVWEWRFEDHPDRFPEEGGGPEDDWTHLNDVDAVGDHLFVASVRNFDQIAFVNRSTGEVEMTLGADGDHDTLHRQHNPDHLRGPDGERTVLVADSLNDRVVEYEYRDDTDEWELIWEVTGLNEPRDADRLPNGNTLVTDRMGHRVVEITPEGEVVWEVYAPYEPYDAERGGPGSEGPTMSERGIEGSFAVHNEADFTEEDVAACADALFEFAPTEPSTVDSIGSWVADRLASGGSSSGGDGTGEDGGIAGETVAETTTVVVSLLFVLILLGVGIAAVRRR